MARQSVPGRARIEDVAARCGVSIMTVSRALRGVEGVSAQKRAEIVAVAARLGYQPNSIAGSLAAANSTLIGISVPTLFEVVFAEIFDGMRATFDKAGFQTVIDTSEYDEEREARWVERMASWHPAGLILTGVDHSGDTLARLERSTTPTLEIWDYTPTPIDLCVGVDHHAAGLAMGRHLVALGYRRPAYVGVAPGRDRRAEGRFRAMDLAFREAGATPLGARRNVAEDTSFRSGFVGVNGLLEAGRRANERPDVITFLNDHLAVGGLMACERAGLSVPGDIGIAGFNGLNINTVLATPLTTSVTPRVQMGEMGARLLVARILGARAERSICLPVRLEPGATTASRI